MLALNYTVVEEGDMSGDITPAATKLLQLVCISFQLSWTGAPVGTVKLQASNDNVVFSDVTNSTVNVSGSGDVLYNLTDIGYLYIRPVYTHRLR